jgi:hypothetical protein
MIPDLYEHLLIPEPQRGLLEGAGVPAAGGLRDPRPPLPPGVLGVLEGTGVLTPASSAQAQPGLPCSLPKTAHPVPATSVNPSLEAEITTS